MSNHSEDVHSQTHDSAKHPLVMWVTDNDFQCEVLEKLARLEAKMDMLTGGSQPGRIKDAEDRIANWNKATFVAVFTTGW
jgi:hypothetical protein